MSISTSLQQISVDTILSSFCRLLLSADAVPFFVSVETNVIPFSERVEIDVVTFSAHPCLLSFSIPPSICNHYEMSFPLQKPIFCFLFHCPTSFFFFIVFPPSTT
ncbi:hypothetical protein MRB53_025990 [Persea americana]|uniref:Uncharacterized protein n=1 Tax=Persea americana TaxID=3435 RepID=A0ACC2LHZ5_PERAE|nr:hypothetical protein MRB53_025990 [Persea americana]